MLRETGRVRDVCKGHCYLSPVRELITGGINGLGALVLVTFFLFQAFLPDALLAGEHVTAMNGMSLNVGYTYDPSDDIWFSQVSIFRLYDYDSIWPHKAPENLMFKVEGCLGGARSDKFNLRMMATVNVFALLYLTERNNNQMRPYVEAGIGGIYTDYRVDGQDYRFNFNPQAGIGLEIDMGKDLTFFAALRVHHLSNGGIGDTNRGQNSVLCLFGRYF